jgi:hypothetical protein
MLIFNQSNICNYTCDVTGIELWSNPILMIAGLVGLTFIMMGIIWLIMRFHRPCVDP